MTYQISALGAGRDGVGNSRAKPHEPDVSLLQISAHAIVTGEELVCRRKALRSTDASGMPARLARSDAGMTANDRTDLAHPESVGIQPLHVEERLALVPVPVP